MSPTPVLIHGAYADSSSWNNVIEPLAGAHRLMAARSDAAAPVR